MSGVELAALGLSLGESLAWGGMYQRSQRMAHWTRRLRREIASNDDSTVLAPVLAFALNQDARPLRPAPGPHSEWFAFQVTAATSGQPVLDSWHRLVEDRDDLLLSVAQHHALSNLARGLAPPQSGHDNPHYFDDSAVFRALAITLIDPGIDTEAARADACISNALDGVDAAAVVSRLVRKVTGGVRLEVAVPAAIEEAAAGSWLRRNLETAVSVATDSPDFTALLRRLDAEIVGHAYNYGNAAPETVPLAIAAALYAKGKLEPALLIATALVRNAGSVAPLAATLCLLADPDQAAGLSEVDTILRGISLPSLKGLDLLKLAGETKGPIING